MLRGIRNPKRLWDTILVLDTARIGRRRHLAIIFEEHECKRHGIKVIYKSLPDSDPITEMLLKSILQAMDEWHSLTSRVKGLAGMSENVKQGYRAGGRAPRGYKLLHIETGTIREGEPVTKSKLVPNDDAMKMRAYLQHRARGVPRSRALELAGGDWPVASLVDTERNALTYAGHTVWNRTSERTEGGYIGGNKYRPRSEWVIQRNTHEPLISDEESETIMAKVEAGSATRANQKAKTKRVYLLSGIMFSPSGERWIGDGGFYRLGQKGTRILAESVERTALDALISDLNSDESAKAILAYYHKVFSKSDTGDAVKKLKADIADLNKRIGTLADLISQTSKPEAFIRKIEEYEATREDLTAELQVIEDEANNVKVMRNITIQEVRSVIRTILDEINMENPEFVRDTMQQMADIVLDPDTFTAKLTYKIPLVSGVRLASPRSIKPHPCYSSSCVIQIAHRRRQVAG